MAPLASTGTLSFFLSHDQQDGSERKVVVDSKIVYPYGVAVDHPNRHIFWVDTYLDYIERAGEDIPYFKDKI